MFAKSRHQAVFMTLGFLGLLFVQPRIAGARLGPMSVAPAVWMDTCKATAASTFYVPTTDPAYFSWLACGGGCDNDPGGNECQSRSKVVGSATYTVCSCDPSVLPACCSLVLEVGQPNDPPQLAGDCPGCGATGTCNRREKYVINYESGAWLKSWEAYCR